MWFSSWFDAFPVRRQLKRSHSNPSRNDHRHRQAQRRLFLEGLEERRMLTFVPAVDYSVGLAPQAIVSADFNNDGHLDLATANGGDSTVSLLLGDGQGGFTAERRLPVSATPLSVAVGDFDSDGNLDLATASDWDVRVMLGDGAGSLGAPAIMGIYGTPDSVAVGDFNGDGKLDLGVTSNAYHNNYYYPGYYNTYYQSYANVLLGNADGTFSAANSTFLGNDYYNTALAADLNGDLNDDFVTFNYYDGSSVLLGDGSGYLQGPTSFLYTGDYSFAVAAGDLDADGDNDLVTANFYGHSISVFLGDGAGGFSGPAHYGTGSSPISLVLGDFTGDGNLDVATANSNQVTILHGSGDGVFSAPTFAAVDSATRAITARDFNGDTWLDIATANSYGNNVSVLLNDGIWPGPAGPLLRIDDVTVTEGNVGTVAAALTVTLSAPSDQPVTVQYDTTDGTAAAGSDYQSASGTLVIPAGETTGTITVLVNGDRLGEANETFFVILSSTNAIITDGQAVVTIVDDEPHITITDATVTEGDAGTVAAVFTVTRSGGDLTGTSTVNYSTANGGALAGSDYVAASGTVTFGPGEATQTITILVNGDMSDEFDQGFYVNLSAPSGAVIVDGQAFGTIVDNDLPPTITITPIVSAKEGNGAGTNLFNFIVTLSVASEKEVRVNFATADGTATTANSDYIVSSGTLVFAPGTTSKTISVQVRGDKKREANERFYVNLTGATNATIAAGQGIGEILDDDNR